MLRVVEKDALASVIENSDNDIVVLFGSPLSYDSSTGDGVPNVNGVMELVESVLKEKKLLDKFNDLHGHSRDGERYQQAFTFLADYTSPNTVNGIIRRAVLEAFNRDTSSIDLNDTNQLLGLQEELDSWCIPEATSALANLLVSNPRFYNTVLTPNFDPLLAVALSKLDFKPSQTVLHGDSSLEQYRPTGHNIVHLHGHWVVTDTLHTPAQLTIDRPKLKNSLAHLLRNKTLLVIGYSGWNDVFTQVLCELMNDTSANIDIVWAFFESDSELITSKYSALIDAMQPAIQRNRFRAYGGIDCHAFLKELSETAPQNDIEIKEGDNVEGKQDSQKEEQILEQVSVELPIWRIPFQQAHLHIRGVEKERLAELLESNHVVNVCADWGLSKEEFIQSFVHDINSPYHGVPTFYLDLEGVKDKKELLTRVESIYGFGLQTLVSSLPNSRSILCIDNVDALVNRAKGYADVFEPIASLFRDYSPSTKLLVCSKQPIVTLCCLTVPRLEEYDIRSYVKHHENRVDTSNERVMEPLVKLSHGVPSLLDKYIDELQLFSIDSVYESHYTPESHKQDTDNRFPLELVTRIENLKNSDDPHGKLSLELLTVLSILEYGDCFTNLKRASERSVFRSSHVKELNGLELIETLPIDSGYFSKGGINGEDKIITLPILVRQYVYAHLTTIEVYEVVKRLADIHLGNQWRVGRLKLCAFAKQLLKKSSKTVGSTRVILMHLLRCAVELDVERDINAALRICKSYCHLLSKYKKHQEVISFCEELHAIAKESDKVGSFAHFNYWEGKSLRLVNLDERAGEKLQLALEEDDELNRSQRVSLYLNLAWFYLNEGDSDNANLMADKVLDIEPKHRDARLIKIELSGVDDISCLKELELNARNNNSISSANNTALMLADLEVSNKAKLGWLNRVIRSVGNEYNQYRAVVRKGRLLIDQDEGELLTKEELRIVMACYIYGFSQRVQGLFNSAHRILWHSFYQKRDFVPMLNLYRQSSLYWRIYDDYKSEQMYSELIADLMARFLPDDIDINQHQYVVIRVRQVTKV